jgi:hypothetical protein
MIQTVLTGACQYLNAPYIIHGIMWVVQAEDGLLVDPSIRVFLTVQDRL